MKKESVLFGVIGLLAGALITSAVATVAVNKDYRGMMRAMGMNMSRVANKDAGHMGMSMNGMQDVLRDKNGDDFDRAFIEMMIAHHEGAVAMAKLAKTNAKHDEVKKMSDDIISAQTKEIQTMQNWQSLWGYRDSSGHMMEH